MKIIISHDIDHLSVKEHLFKDLIIPKYIFWSLLELSKGKISFRTFGHKISGLFKENGWNNLKELMDFDRRNGVNSTFFIGVNNAKGLIYSKEQARKAIELIKENGFDVGVHGICYDDSNGIKKEHDDFKSLSGMDKFGIRMHYLRMDDKTLDNLGSAGYLFDTTVLSNPSDYKVKNMTEVPFQIMDSNFFGPLENYTLEEAKKRTIEMIGDEKYFSVLFHQRNFSDEFPDAKEWYIWLINYFKSRNFEFVSYKNYVQ